jgi:hypothetical protein
MRINKNFLMLFFITFFIGCATTVSDTVSTTDYLGIDGIDYDEADKIKTSLQEKVYFDFDKSALSNSTKEVLSKYVEESKKASIIRLEGHCDERGTREYNLALGEKRAIEVKLSNNSRSSLIKNKNHKLWRREANKLWLN